MRIKHLLNFFVATVFIGVAVGCAEKDLYDPISVFTTDYYSIFYR